MKIDSPVVEKKEAATKPAPAVEPTKSEPPAPEKVEPVKSDPPPVKPDSQKPEPVKPDPPAEKVEPPKPEPPAEKPAPAMEPAKLEPPASDKVEPVKSDPPPVEKPDNMVHTPATVEPVKSAPPPVEKSKTESEMKPPQVEPLALRKNSTDKEEGEKKGELPGIVVGESESGDVKSKESEKEEDGTLSAAALPAERTTPRIIRDLKDLPPGADYYLLDISPLPPGIYSFLKGTFCHLTLVLK